eukprot:3065870-Amphidinium_carterae.1
MVYVDDLLLIGDDDKVKTFLQQLESQLQLKHVTKLQPGQPLVFLGRQIEYYKDHIALSMTKDYYKSLLSLYNIKENSNSLSTTGTKRPPITTGEPLNSEEHSTYRTIVGKLLWMCPLRPDIQYATKELTRSIQKPVQHDRQSAKHLLRYVHGTRNYKLHLRPREPTNNDPYIKAYCDSDWARCSTTRMSTTGTVPQFAGVTIATSSLTKTQQTIAQSSAEAALYAIGTTVNDVIYVRNFLHELNFTTDDKLKPQIYTDSSSAKCLTLQLGLTKGTKHIDMRYLHVQQLQSDGELKIHKVSTENNPSDLMTKYLETAKIKKHRETIGLHAYIGNKSINMLHQRPLRPRGSYTTRPRGSTPQPRQREQRKLAYIEVNEDYIVKVEEPNHDDEEYRRSRIQYFPGEAANNGDVNYESQKDIKTDFSKLLDYFRQFLRLLLSIGRLCDDWRRRPIQGILYFVQRHDEISNTCLPEQRLYFS